MKRLVGLALVLLSALASGQQYSVRVLFNQSQSNEFSPIGLSPAGAVCGTFRMGTRYYGSLWESGAITIYYGYGQYGTGAEGVNSSRVEAGDVTTSNGDSHAAIWDSAGFHDIHQSGSYSDCSGINQRGSACGDFEDNAGDHSFIYRNGQMIDLGSILESVTIPAPTRSTISM